MCRCSLNFKIFNNVPKKMAKKIFLLFDFYITVGFVLDSQPVKNYSNIYSKRLSLN